MLVDVGQVAVHGRGLPCRRGVVLREAAAGGDDAGGRGVRSAHRLHLADLGSLRAAYSGDVGRRGRELRVVAAVQRTAAREEAGDTVVACFRKQSDAHGAQPHGRGVERLQVAHVVGVVGKLVRRVADADHLCDGCDGCDGC